MSESAAKPPVPSGSIIFGAPEGQDARILAERARALMPQDRVLMHVALDDARTGLLQELLEFFAPDVKVVVFPAWDCLPYDRISPNAEIVAQRVAALVQLMAWEEEQARYPRILLTTVNAALQRVMPKDILAQASLSATVGGRLDVAQLQAYLADNGYMRTETVREAGEFSIRGGIIDIFPAGHEMPVRLDLFGDEVESIRAFDPLSQRSGEKIKSFTLQPATEFFLDEESVARFRAGYREAFGVVQDNDPLYESVSEARRYNGMDHWLPLFHQQMDTLFDYTPNAAVIFDHHTSEAHDERLAQIQDFFEARKTLEEAAARKDKKAKDVSLSGTVYHPLPPAALYLREEEWGKAVDEAQEFSPFGAPDEAGEDGGAKKGRDFADIRALPEGDVFAELKKYLASLAAKQIPSPHGGEGQGEGDKKASAKQIEFARDLRKQNTETEKLLWNQLRNRAVADCKFRRQHPVGPYVVDFICLEKGLVVEVDGYSHDTQVEHDKNRTVFLEKEGFSVVRFTNEEVKQNLDGVIQKISKAVESPLTPTLSPEGRGGNVERKVIIACYSEGSKERLKGLLESAAIDLSDIDLVVLHLERGFVADDLAVITEQDILGDRLARKSQKKRKADNFLTEISTLAEGDLVVHIDHGIGKFIALETVAAGKTLHDCLKIEYAGGDRLFVPVENIEVLSRFGSDEGTVQLDKLGGAGWQARKSKVKKDLMAIADHLLKIAAARTLKKAQKLDVSEGIYNEFAARFPYQETEDQQRAIEDVLADLSAQYPMDRLVCGDVGFGKTEVAMRAAYVAAMEGTQVAVAVPTTLLARQHYQNFAARFSGTGLRVAQLSRLVSAKDAKATKEGLADGSVNIVIGTHALFSKDVKFANLALMIVDEEQRFGVKQKERLKEMKNNVHILTLTATPIPRTLQMALTGVREMSLITTPPVDRLAIRTFVMPFDSMVIREALLREHYRGGQSFYVCPRVKDMKELKDTLKELVPEVKVIDAHGQMTPTELEDRMTAFYDGQYDVLLATNIIESGIDIPTANTMIVHRADMFGLAQLYQIRGRIGRSKVRAYAYLTYQPGAKLNDQAMKRLEVMETLDTLGSGFQLASHDMDIRGAGNLLGDQQSGHIKEVGVELYQQMLEEAVAMAREGVDLDDVPQESWSPNINIGTSVLIPETYVGDLGVRMSLYRRLTDLHGPDDIESFAAELIDRFGPLPEEVQNLLDIVAIKQLCKQAGVSTVEAGPKGAVIGFHKDTPPNVAGIMGWIQEQRGSVKLRPDQKIVAVRHWDSPAKRVKGVQSLMKELAVL